MAFLFARACEVYLAFAFALTAAQRLRCAAAILARAAALSLRLAGFFVETVPVRPASAARAR